MRTLVIPPAAQRDANAIQMISGWIAEKGLHTTLNIGMWKEAGRDEPKAWGIFLSDVVRHIANAIEESTGAPRGDTTATILAAMDREFAEPTSDVSGGFHPGHS
jgi:hypothetical protein